MPSVDMESLLHDIQIIKVQVQNYLNNFYGKPKAYTVSPKMLKTLTDTVTTYLRHVYVTMNKRSDSVKSVDTPVESLTRGDIDKFNDTVSQISRICSKVEGTLNNYYAAGPQVMSDLLIDVTDLNRYSGNLVDILRGMGDRVGVEENQDLDTLRADDIEMGQLYLVFDRHTKDVRFGMSRSVIQTSKGKTVSSNEDGTGAVPVQFAVYLDPGRFVPERLVDVMDTLYEYERDSESDEVSSMARRTGDQVLEFIGHVVDMQKVVDTAMYKVRYFKG